MPGLYFEEFEEGQVYRWISSVMDEPEQSDLAASVEQELRNRPPRFTLAEWEKE